MKKVNKKGEAKAKPAPSGIIRDKQGKFVKGVSGNPTGRPEGILSLSSMLRAKLKKVDKKKQRTYAELLIDRIVNDAATKGDAQQIKNILQYVEGMPKQTVHNENRYTDADGNDIDVFHALLISSKKLEEKRVNRMTSPKTED